MQGLEPGLSILFFSSFLLAAARFVLVSGVLLGKLNILLSLCLNVMKLWKPPAGFGGMRSMKSQKGAVLRGEF